MLGPAEKIYQERMEKKNHSFELDSFFAGIDRALAEMLLQPFSAFESSSSDFICYLSAAARKGHLCVQVTSDSILPELLALDIVPEKSLQQNICRGAEKLPEQLYKSQNSPIKRLGDRFYFARNWLAEGCCFNRFKELLIEKPFWPIEESSTEIEINSLLHSGKLEEEQAECIRKARNSCLTLLCGGPGTGKTYTVAHLLRILQHGIACEKRPNFMVAVAAPTGKAATHLEKTIQRENLISHHRLQASTLHALLGLREGKKEKVQLLSADLIIVDECSMIDLKVMNALLAAVKPGARLILMGDPHQLAPVEMGTLFADFIAYSQLLEPPYRPIELKKCLRTELKSIVELATEIKKGNADSLFRILHSPVSEGAFYHLIENEEKIQRVLVEKCINRFDPHSKNAEEILEQFNSFRLLSPLRNGPLGVNALNQLLAQGCAKKYGKSLVAPIILTKNDHRLGLYNGEVGVMVGEQYALFSPSTGDPRRIAAALLPPYEYAYCLSIYKSQGSEFEEVWVILPQGSEIFGRELLYTAVTRARKTVEIWGSESVLRATISRRMQRMSGIINS